jgi:hypothetical protein
MQLIENLKTWAVYTRRLPWRYRAFFVATSLHYTGEQVDLWLVVSRLYVTIMFTNQPFSAPRHTQNPKPIKVKTEWILLIMLSSSSRSTIYWRIVLSFFLRCMHMQHMQPTHAAHRPDTRTRHIARIDSVWSADVSFGTFYKDLFIKHTVFGAIIGVQSLNVFLLISAKIQWIVRNTIFVKMWISSRHSRSKKIIWG